MARLSSSRQCEKGDLWAGEVRLAGPHFWFAVGGCSGKSELKEPKRSRLLAHRQHGSGSIRRFDRTLLEAIEEGIVPRPGLLTYQDWNSWRARDGQRPSKRRHGDDERTTTTAEEAQLWRTVMEALYGPEWKDQLAVAGGALEETEEEEEEEEEEERLPTTLARAPEGGVRMAQGAEPPAIGPGGSAASSTVGGESVFRDMSLVRLQEVFLKDYAPGSETAVRFAKRLRRVSEALGLLGEEVDEASMERRVIRALYWEKIYEADEERQLGLLKEFFQELVLDDSPHAGARAGA